MDINHKITAICDKNGITQRRLAAFLGISDTSLTRWKIGLVNPNNQAKILLELLLVGKISINNK